MSAVLPPVSHISRTVLELLFPGTCIGCGREGAFVCHDCRASFVPVGSPFCRRCGRPLDGPGECLNCSGETMITDGIRAPFLFQGLVRQAVHEIKYRNLKALAPLLAGELAAYLQDSDISGHVLVPVPLHPRRLRERGYNQSGLVARHLSRLTGVPLMEKTLVRLRHTPPLARSASREERRAGVIGAFGTKGNGLAGKDVILIDDVSTTGATLDACAAVLKNAGSRTVWGLVFALEL